MKMTTSWAFASAAVVAFLVAGCTTDTTNDTSEGGVTTGAAGTSAGTAGSGGGGEMGTGGGGASGAGGTSSDTDGGAQPMSDCEKCAYAKCKMEADACEADTMKNGCAAFVDDFYTCLKTADTAMKVDGCGSDFASMVSAMGMSQSLSSELSGCMTDSDPAKGCLAECGAMSAGGGSDGGTE
jgi:hypothetical protein